MKRYEVKTKILFTTNAESMDQAINKLEKLLIQLNSTNLPFNDIGNIIVPLTIPENTQVLELPF